MKPRIVCILPNFDPDTGSHFFHIYELLEAAARELDIFLVVEKADAYPLSLQLPFYCQKLRFGPLRFMELVFVLSRERFRGRKYFYTHYSFFGAIASWLTASLTGGKSFYWNCGMPWLYQRSLFEEMIFRFVLRRNILVTGTNSLAREYRRRYGLNPNKMRVLPNRINLARFRSGPRREECRRLLGLGEDRKVILFVHRLSRRKGADLIPEIAAAVTKRNKNVIFMVVGDGPEEANLKLEIRNLKLEPYVRLAGEIPNRKVQDYFKAADILIMPSEEEGFPHVLLEAQAVGLPYVASDVGGAREITPSAMEHFIVPPKDVRAFTSRIVELLGIDSLERLRIAKILTSQAERYDLQKVLPQFRSLFA